MSARARVIATSAVLGATASLLGFASPGIASSGTASSSAADAHQASKTAVTLQVSGCEGCSFRLIQALNSDKENVWQSKAKKVEDGEVSWTVASTHTYGLSITIDASWDGGTGAVPNVVFRYAGLHEGDAVTNKIAKTKKRASGCWAGTDADEVTIPITVVHAATTNPPGDPIKSPRAFTSLTQDFLKPMYRSPHGFLGNQDALWCGPEN